MTALLKFLLIAFCAYYLLRLVFRLVIGSYLGKVQDQARQQFEQQQKAGRKKAEKPVGKVTVDYVQGESKTFSEKEGEYVDFEEVK